VTTRSEGKWPASALPGSGPGADLRSEFDAWLSAITSDPWLHRLADLSGWEVPASPTATPADILAAMAEQSAGWDFRNGSERHQLSFEPARIGGRELDEDTVAAAAAALGLKGGMPVSGSFSHVIVLAGMVRACANRARLARQLCADLGTHRLVVLTAHRAIAGDEPDQASALGWNPLDLESDAAVEATRQEFGLAEEPDRNEEMWLGEVAPPAGTDLDAAEYGRRQSWFWRSWPGHPTGSAPGTSVEVVAAPSPDPVHRRTNTAYQLTFWAARARIGTSHRLLFVTTEHYVPYSQLRAVRTLALTTGCGIVHTGTPWAPSGPFRAVGYLQELRATLLAARDLHNSLTARQP